jgi:hypothetical protein
MYLSDDRLMAYVICGISVVGGWWVYGPRRGLNLNSNSSVVLYLVCLGVCGLDL